jgi:DNA helicase-2/ATP-dependent DNA helicase PcrA
VKIDYQKELNPEQLEVVLSGDGPCLVLAGAGSGKTRTVTYRVAYLLEQGIHPQEILLLTFTNKAAKEMLERVNTLIPPPSRGGAGGEVIGGTFHSTAARILRSYAHLVGRTVGFTIFDEDDSKSLIKLCLKEAGIDSSRDKRYPSPSSFQSMWSYARNAGLTLCEVLERRNPAFVGVGGYLDTVAEQYESRKRASNAVDFDDLLLLFMQLLQNRPDVRERLASQFRYVLVDEFQDTNFIQGKIVQMLSSVHRNLLVVGDDAQSIYSFRAAEIRNILDFPKAYVGTKVFRLTSNYRSSPEILSLANASIKNNQDQFEKPLKAMREAGKKPKLFSTLSTFEEARKIADEISRLQTIGVPTSEIAVLFRAAFQAQPLEFELMKRNVAYEFRGGLRFFERAHIKDVIAHLRLLANMKDEAAWIRTLGLYPGIGASTAQKILDQVKTFESLESAISSEDVSPTRAASGWDICCGVLKHMIAAPHPSDMIRAVVANGYRDYLEAEQPDFRDRLDDLEQFAVFAQTSKDLHNFLDEVTLAESYASTGRPASGSRIVLSTIHQAKGLEWDAVFVIGLCDGGFPNPRALAEGEVEEERRLFYVATTRARENLYLTYALSDGRNTSDFSYGQPSMFIEELPKNIFEEVKHESFFSSTPSGRRSQENRWSGDDAWEDNEPTIVVDNLGEPSATSFYPSVELKNKSKKSGFSFLRDVNEL